jgi:hypothetical protein
MEESLKNESLEVREFLNKNGLVELNRQREEQQDGQRRGDPAGGEQKKKPHSSVRKRFRRFYLPITVAE